MPYEYDTEERAAPIVLDLWDSDQGLLESNDFLGRTVIFLNDPSPRVQSCISRDANEIRNPVWLPVSRTMVVPSVDAS